MMQRAEREAHFRSHATAVIRGDFEEAERLLEPLYPREFLGHFVFVFALFASVVVEHFGEAPERSALDAFGARLRERWPGVASLKCEAMIRVVYGEQRLFTEIPQVDHHELMWTVITGLVDVDVDDTELAGLFDRADETAKDFVKAVFASETLASWRDDPEGSEAGGSGDSGPSQGKEVRDEA
jgi:hypothetical protein